MQPVGVQPRHGENGVLPGDDGGGQRVKQLGAQAVLGVFEGGQLGVDPADGVGRLGGLGAQLSHDLALPGLHGLHFGQGPRPAQDGQPHPALVALGRHDLDEPHLAGGGGMGAAAGADVRPRDGDDPHLAAISFLLR